MNPVQKYILAAGLVKREKKQQRVSRSRSNPWASVKYQRNIRNSIRDEISVALEERDTLDKKTLSRKKYSAMKLKTYVETTPTLKRYKPPVDCVIHPKRRKSFRKNMLC